MATHQGLVSSDWPSASVFYAGFAFLPWLWLVNVWLFWHEFRAGQDLVIQKREVSTRDSTTTLLFDHDVSACLQTLEGPLQAFAWLLLY